jgi:hypothetical protein
MMINFVISKFLIFRKRAAVPHPRPDTPAKPAA